MARKCTVCTHQERDEIEKAHLAGRPFRGIARDFAASEDAVARHLKRHLVERLVRAAERRENGAGDDLLDRLTDLNRMTLEILCEARRTRKHEVALKAIARAEAQLELQARITGEIRDRTVNVVNVQLDPETAARMAEMYLARRGNVVVVGAEATR